MESAGGETNKIIFWVYPYNLPYNQLSMGGNLVGLIFSSSADLAGYIFHWCSNLLKELSELEIRAWCTLRFADQKPVKINGYFGKQ